MQQTIRADFPWQVVAVDAINKLPKAPNGDQHLCVFVDYLTGWVEAYPTKDLTALTFAKLFVDEIIPRHGAPWVLLSDNGGQFAGEIVKETLKLLDIKKANTTPYHPKCNGKVENMNAKLEQVLRTICDGQPEKWRDLLPQALFALRTMRSSATNETPFYLMYGRDPYFLVDVNYVPESSHLSINDKDFLLDYVERLQAAQLSASETLRKNAEARNKRVNLTRKDITFEPNDFVWLKRFDKRRYPKLTKLRRGPYKVLRRTSPVNYLIEIKPGKNITVNVANMLKHIEPVDAELDYADSFKQVEIPDEYLQPPYRDPDLPTPLDDYTQRDKTQPDLSDGVSTQSFNDQKSKIESVDHSLPQGRSTLTEYEKFAATQLALGCFQYRLDSLISLLDDLGDVDLVKTQVKNLIQDSKYLNNPTTLLSELDSCLDKASLSKRLIDLKGQLPTCFGYTASPPN